MKRDHRRDEHAHRYSRIGQSPDHPQPPRRRRAARLQPPRDLVVEVVERDRDRREPLRRHRRQEIDVALDRRVLGDETDRLIELAADFDDRARDFPLALDRLIGVGVDADHDLRAFVSRPRQLLAQKLGRVRLREDARLEIDAGREIAVGVRGTGVAINTTMLASRYGLIDCEKPTSGESLWLMMLFARSTVTCVLSGGSSSCSASVQPSSNASRATFSKRPSGLMPAPRPLRGSACLPVRVLRGMPLRGKETAQSLRSSGLFTARPPLFSTCV